MRRFLLFPALLGLGLGFPGLPALAQDLVFRDALRESENFIIHQHFGEKGAYAVAALDLNQDNIPELIVRPEGCAPGEACLHTILADADGKAIELGEIRAIRLAPGENFSHGVRDLRVWQNPDNDFAHNIYAWDSSASRYKILK